MKPKRILVFAILVSVLLFAPQAYTAPFWDIPTGTAGTDYLVSDFAGSSADFSFWNINPITFQYTAGTDTFNVEFKFSAPQNWGGAYASYTPNSLLGLSSTSFNDVYGYFYKVTETANTGLRTFEIGYDQLKASVLTGSVTGPDVNVGLQDLGGSVLATFTGGAGTFGALKNQTSDWFYMTSKNWWGWSDTLADSQFVSGSVGLNDYTMSPSGQIPAPNPEAPTIALYLMGLFGVGWFTRMKYFIKEKI